MSGYSIWYLLKPTDPLHEQISKFNEELGDEYNIPAHIPILNNIKTLDTAMVLFDCYRKKKKPIFRVERPIVSTSETGKQLSFVLRSDGALHELPIATRSGMFFSHELKKINIDRRYILQGEYELVVYDCRTRDKKFWKPLH